MDSFDIIPDSDQIETLFIMESPYKDEIESGIACVGDAGIRMAKVILNNEAKSFGKLLDEKDPSILSFGIMNAFPFPLELPKLLNQEQKEYTSVKDINWIPKKTVRSEFYNSHLKTLGDLKLLEEQTKFKERLIRYINECPNLKNLIFCGYISQSVYLKLFEQSVIAYNRMVQKPTKSGRVINLLFVNHPSNRNDSWDFDPNVIK